VQIAFDVSPLTRTRRGVWRYTSELVSAVAGQLPQHSIAPINDQPIPAGVLPSCIDRADEIPTRNLPRTLWMAAAVGPAVEGAGVDLLHCTSFYAPLRTSVPTVVNVYDLSVFDRNSVHPPLRVAKAHLLLRRSIERAAAIICPSQTVRADIHDRFSVTPDNVHVVPGAPAASFTPNGPVHDGSAHYLLFIGGSDTRKRLNDAITAVDIVNRDIVNRNGHPIELLVVGAGTEPAVASAHVRILGEISDGRLAELMRGAEALIHPSIHEGFGLPVVEAMNAGLAVIAADIPAIRELFGPAAVELVPPRAPDALAAAIARILIDHTHRASLVEEGHRVAARFTWRDSARRVLDIYERVLTNREVPA
jgi:glycosyltransferase involved in cell wall biosynthesis